MISHTTRSGWMHNSVLNAYFWLKYLHSPVSYPFQWIAHLLSFCCVRYRRMLSMMNKPVCIDNQFFALFWFTIYTRAKNNSSKRMWISQCGLNLYFLSCSSHCRDIEFSELIDLFTFIQWTNRVQIQWISCKRQPFDFPLLQCQFFNPKRLVLRLKDFHKIYAEIETSCPKQRGKFHNLFSKIYTVVSVSLSVGKAIICTKTRILGVLSS